MRYLSRPQTIIQTVQRYLCVGLSLSSLSAASALATNLPIQIDGDAADWTAEALLGTDVSGDAGSTGIDFTQLDVANDGDWVYFHFDTTVEIQGDEGQDIVVALDTDQNPATGFAIEGIGAELVWRLGDRNGTLYPGASPMPVSHPDVGLVLGPTVSDVQLEFCLDRGATPFGHTLFPGNAFDIVVRDDAAGDVIGPYTYTFSAGNIPIESIALPRDDANHIRVSAYNIENDGLFDNSNTRELAIDHLLEAIDADVWVFCEVWNHNASEVSTRLEDFLPSGPGESWNTIKLDQGNVIATRLPILDSWLILEGSRLTAALVDLRPRYDSDLLVVANHWSCCTADDNRQDQADALIAFLRDARSSGGLIDLVPETPIVAAGDFNLVGLRQQLETLLTGDIVDNGAFGPDSAPDWDGSTFDLAMPRHPDARFVYTWRNDASSFYPGKLDFLAFTGSSATLHNNFILETRGMSFASLAAAGLASTDTGTASDHAPVVGDLSVNVASQTPDNPVSGDALVLQPAHPNPFRNKTTLAFATAMTGPATVTIYDTTGRKVRQIIDDTPRPEGQGHVLWDGHTQDGNPAPAGPYIYRIAVGENEQTGTVIRLR